MVKRDALLLLLAFTLGLLFASSLLGETRQIETDQDLVVLTIPASDTALIDWEARQPEGIEYASFRLADGTSAAVVCTCSHERIIMVGDVIDWDARTRNKIKWIITPKTPPGPEPEPEPTPDPIPPPDPTVPFPAPGLAVLVIYEAGQVGRLPASQQAIFSSRKLLRFLSSKAVEIDGDPAVRIWDKDYTQEQMKNVPEVFRKAYFDVRDEAAGQLPWIAVTNGQRGWQGPLPQTVNDVMELVDGFAD